MTLFRKHQIFKNVFLSEYSFHRLNIFFNFLNNYWQNDIHRLKCNQWIGDSHNKNKIIFLCRSRVTAARCSSKYETGVPKVLKEILKNCRRIKVQILYPATMLDSDILSEICQTMVAAVWWKDFYQKKITSITKIDKIRYLF